jgi:formylmethanofuran dehydrogenase subunit C
MKMTLVLTLSQTSPIPIEVEGITPDRVQHKSLAEIQRLRVYHGNEKSILADFFAVAGDPTDGAIRWEGDLAGVHWIGAKMTSGRVHVAGSAGRHVGSEMTGGQIVVDGHVSDWLGGEMHGGLIHVRGDAGHLTGAAYRGSPQGMTGGTILVGGRAGNEIGHSMRRGMVAVAGEAGDLAGFNMLAGTILMFGPCGIRHGAAMRRGTIGIWSKQRPELLPSFRFASRLRPQFLPLIFAQLQRLGFAVPDEAIGADVDLYHGDLLEGGRGEILLGAAP